ncbi:hypothetical protein [Paenibacillus larvae]|uniref:Uncharacterized protein n=1 Tax=Paenibacillus larvae subsp. larvae TaxID=147375 RepID=A0A6C0QQF4_9BACL|nr:hypothetical protein [Paenibacillus larvae]QHZ50934.1 hypothetical protein ERICV_01779 [Paenibacillus larvae subsp. larvae]
MEYTIWDKKESINGVPAKKVLESNPHWVDADLILIMENGRITRIEDIQIINANAGGNLFDENDSLEVKAQKVFEHIVKEREEQENAEAHPDSPVPEQRIRDLEEALNKQKEDMDKAIMELTFALGGAKKDV